MNQRNWCEIKSHTSLPNALLRLPRICTVWDNVINNDHSFIIKLVNKRHFKKESSKRNRNINASLDAFDLRTPRDTQQISGC